MAIGTGEEMDLDVEEQGFISEDSDFYGDDAEKEDFLERAANFNILKYWENRTPSLMEIAEMNIEAAKKEDKPTILYNPYESISFARQLHETVDEFLQRLPPAETQMSPTCPWIFVANPFRKVPKSKTIDFKQEEAPPDEDSNWAQFVRESGELLHELTRIRHSIEKEKAGKAQSTITRAINVQKATIVQKILDTAAELHCTSGKWMLFCSPQEVNAVWEVIARNTVNNELGIAAKVAPDDGSTRVDRLMCIYTKDFTDMEDVTRVLKKLKELGLVEAKGRAIYYKCDAYTHLGLNSGNQYDIKASLYNSIDVLKPNKNQEPKQKKLDSLFYKKDPEDWRQVK